MSHEVNDVLSVSASMAGGKDRVLCARLPLQGASLLMPYACVAEIVNLSLRSHVGAFLGEVDWRNVRIPAISLERACGRVVELARGRARLAILYGLSTPEHLPYYAIVLDGAPRSESVSAEHLKDGPVSDCVLLGSRVMLDGQAYYIPNLEAIESWLEGVLRSKRG